MDYKEFRESKLKLHGEKHYKISGSLGVKDAYRWLRKNKWPGMGAPMTEKDFYSIIRAVNQELAKELTSGTEITLPQKMGKLGIRKTETFVKFEEGKIKTNRTIDWSKTLHLWHEDPEAEKDKILIRKENKEIFLIHYDRYTANYNNKVFYQFKPHRVVTTTLKDNIEKGLIDAYQLY